MFDFDRLITPGSFDQWVEFARQLLLQEFEWLVLAVLVVLVVLLVETSLFATLALLLAGGSLGRASLEFLRASLRAPKQSFKPALMAHQTSGLLGVQPPAQRRHSLRMRAD